ncbi:MAG: CRISPR-associated endonuclease Cas2 [Fimbriimonadaceae bacterium]
MWVLLTFDLPVVTKEQKREYVRFVKKLEREGFIRLQWSVFARPCPSEEQAKRHVSKVTSFAPAEGEIRMLQLTDMQFGRQKIIFGKTERPAEKTPPQLTLF